MGDMRTFVLRAVVNAVALWAAASLVDGVHLGETGTVRRLAGVLNVRFSIDAFFWDAVLAALIVTLISWALGVLVPDHASRR